MFTLQDILQGDTCFKLCLHVSFHHSKEAIIAFQHDKILFLSSFENFRREKRHSSKPGILLSFIKLSFWPSSHLVKCDDTFNVFFENLRREKLHSYKLGLVPVHTYIIIIYQVLTFMTIKCNVGQSEMSGAMIKLMQHPVRLNAISVL